MNMGNDIKRIFIFPNNTEVEADIIANFLAQENISFKTKEHREPVFCDYEDDEPCDYISIYDIICFTDLQHFDFVKAMTDEKIKKRRMLNKLFYSKTARKSKRVRERIEKNLNANLHNKKQK